MLFLNVYKALAMHYRHDLRKYMAYMPFIFKGLDLLTGAVDWIYEFVHSLTTLLQPYCQDSTMPVHDIGRASKRTGGIGDGIGWGNQTAATATTTTTSTTSAILTCPSSLSCASTTRVLSYHIYSSNYVPRPYLMSYPASGSNTLLIMP